MNEKRSPKRMVVEAVLDNIRRTLPLLYQKIADRASCKTSWNQRRDLSQKHPDIIKWTEDDAKHEKAALAGYDRDIQGLEDELKTWQQSLSHALDMLEVRA